MYSHHLKNQVLYPLLRKFVPIDVTLMKLVKIQTFQERSEERLTSLVFLCQHLFECLFDYSPHMQGKGINCNIYPQRE